MTLPLLGHEDVPSNPKPMYVYTSPDWITTDYGDCLVGPASDRYLARVVTICHVPTGKSSRIEVDVAILRHCSDPNCYVVNEIDMAKRGILLADSQAVINIEAKAWAKAMHKHNPIFDDVKWKML